MITTDIQKLKIEFLKLDRTARNIERKTVRRAMSAAYEDAWKGFHASYPFIKKNARAKGFFEVFSRAVNSPLKVSTFSPNSTFIC